MPPRPITPHQLNGQQGLTELISAITQGTATTILDDDSPAGNRDYIGPTLTGCTAVTALICDSMLHVANAGDCRAVLSKNGLAVALSDDHKPDNELEGRRIRQVSRGASKISKANLGLFE